MIPILFNSSATVFTNKGLGVLTDAENCRVSMQDSQYELEMSYPVEGAHFSDIAERNIIFAKPCQTDDPQPFRIYRITKPINGKITIFARHISYDLSGIPILPFTASSASDFATNIAANAAVNCPFTFQTNISKSETFEIKFPHTARELLSENSPSWAETYGGELAFDGYTVKLLSSAGQNRGVVIRYGVDLVDAKMEENIAAVYTGILPYFWDEQSDTVIVGTILNASGTFNYTKILPVDLSEYILLEEATQEKVEEVGQTWLEENLIGLPQISLTLSYAQINQTVRLYDTVTVKVEKMGIDVMAKVTSTVYDVLKERYVSINVGDVRETFASDIYDASRLKTGLLDLKRIKDRSIAGGKMASGAVGSRVLADWSVIRSKLAPRSVDGNIIELGSVSFNHADSTIRGYFDGSLVFSKIVVQNHGLVIGGKTIYITPSGQIITED